MTQATKPRLTLEEFLTYDDGTDTRYEWVNEVLVEMGAESTLNTLIAGFLFATFLQIGVPSYRIGFKQLIAVSRSTVRDPDLIVHSEASFSAINGASQALIPVDATPPTLVIEVVSPGEPGSDNYDRDYLDKRREYQLRGVPEYWIVDPVREVVFVLTLNEKEYQTREFRTHDRILSPNFPALLVTVAQVLSVGR